MNDRLVNVDLDSLLRLYTLVFSSLELFLLKSNIYRYILRIRIGA